VSDELIKEYVFLITVYRKQCDVLFAVTREYCENVTEKFTVIF